MKKILLFFTFLIFIASCAVKKQITSVSTDSISEYHIDSVIIKSKIIAPDSIKATTDIDLNQVDYFKHYYTESKPFITYDSTGQTKIESYIDSTNHLKQKIITKPKNIMVSDTNKISNSNKKEIKSDTKVIVETKEPSFFQKLWITIKNFIWFIVIGVLLFIIIYIFRKFNVIGLIKSII